MIKKDILISLRLSSEIYKRIKDLAKKYNYSNSKVINVILESFFYSREVNNENK